MLPRRPLVIAAAIFAISLCNGQAADPPAKGPPAGNAKGHAPKPKMPSSAGSKFDWHVVTPADLRFSAVFPMTPEVVVKQNQLTTTGHTANTYDYRSRVSGFDIFQVLVHEYANPLDTRTLALLDRNMLEMNAESHNFDPSKVTVKDIKKNGQAGKEYTTELPSGSTLTYQRVLVPAPRRTRVYTIYTIVSRPSKAVVDAFFNAVILPGVGKSVLTVAEVPESGPLGTENELIQLAEPGRPSADGLVAKPPIKVPPAPAGSPSLNDLATSPARFANREPVVLHLRMGTQTSYHRNKLQTLNQVGDENGRLFSSAEFFVPPDIADALKPSRGFTDTPQMHAVRLTVVQLAPGDPRREVAGKKPCYEVREIAFFEDVATIGLTYRTGGGSDAATPVPKSEPRPMEPEVSVAPPIATTTPSAVSVAVPEPKTVTDANPSPSPTSPTASRDADKTSPDNAPRPSEGVSKAGIAKPPGPSSLWLLWLSGGMLLAGLGLIVFGAVKAITGSK